MTIPDPEHEKIMFIMNIHDLEHAMDFNPFADMNYNEWRDQNEESFLYDYYSVDEQDSVADSRSYIEQDQKTMNRHDIDQTIPTKM